MRALTRSAAAPLLILVTLAGGEPDRIPAAPQAQSAAAQPAPHLPPHPRTADNRPPEIRALRLEPLQPAPDESLRVIADTFDPDGDTVQLSHRWFYQGKEFPGDTDHVTFIHSKKQDWIEVRVTPSDGVQEGQLVKAETRVANRAPSSVSLRMEPGREIQAGTAIVARPYSRDSDGDAVRLEYSWTVNGLPQPAEGDTFFTHGLKRGDKIRVRVVASDGEADSPPATSEEIEVRNAPPEIVSRPSGLDARGRFVYQLEVKDPDDRRFSYRLAARATGYGHRPRDGSDPVEAAAGARRHPPGRDRGRRPQRRPFIPEVRTHPSPATSRAGFALVAPQPVHAE
jgi:hypothetical protein